MKSGKFNWKKLIKWMVIFVLIVLALLILTRRFRNRRANLSMTETTTYTAKVETRDITRVLSSSGTIEPKNNYEVKTLVEGEIIQADFEEGDNVEEGQVLYRISTDDLNNKIETAETKVTRAETDYDKAKVRYDEAEEKYREAKDDYEEAYTKYSNPVITASQSGIVKAVAVKEGDRVQKGGLIAELYDNSSMLLQIYFNSWEVDQSLVGRNAKVTMSDNMETLLGKVTKVSGNEEVISGNRLVKKVTIQVENPGGITTETIATAEIGSIAGIGEGKFQPITQKVITSELAGEISTLHMEEGSQIKAGDILVTLDEESIKEQLEPFEKSLEAAEDTMENAREGMENANEAIEDARSALKEIIDTRTDYSVTAPISGRIIKKNSLSGDSINFNTVLCTIYDLSSMKFNMYIDELDVLSISTGMEVNITADALTGTMIKGTVLSVSLESTSNQGVTQYPVTVTIDEPGSLLPGMNVTGEIILEKAEGVLAIPSDALMRGNLVYVADPSVKEAVEEVPAGFRAVSVETGITDGDYIEIRNGLSGEEEVYVKRTSGLEEVNFFMPGVMQGGSGEFNRTTGQNGEVRFRRDNATGGERIFRD